MKQRNGTREATNFLAIWSLEALTEYGVSLKSHWELPGITAQIFRENCGQLVKKFRDYFNRRKKIW